MDAIATPTQDYVRITRHNKPCIVAKARGYEYFLGPDENGALRLEVVRLSMGRSGTRPIVKQFNSETELRDECPVFRGIDDLTSLLSGTPVDPFC